MNNVVDRIYIKTQSTIEIRKILKLCEDEISFREEVNREINRREQQELLANELDKRVLYG
tara:strand:+ start:923 stop:1102 length:180 start_codon:yes stop_codon:yes gene_type:complete